VYKKGGIWHNRSFIHTWPWPWAACVCLGACLCLFSVSVPGPGLGLRVYVWAHVQEARTHTHTSTHTHTHTTNTQQTHTHTHTQHITHNTHSTHTHTHTHSDKCRKLSKVEDKREQAHAPLKLPMDLQEQGAYEAALALHQEALERYTKKMDEAFKALERPTNATDPTP
jgi:hypothetical protein